MRAREQSPALIHCVLSFTEAIWTLNLISWRTVFAWDMTKIYDPTLPPSDWSEFHHMNQFDQWQVLLHLLFNDHWLFITISSWFSEKSRDQPGPEVKAAKCETDWENYQRIMIFMTIFTQTVWCDRADTWGQTGESQQQYKTELYVPGGSQLTRSNPPEITEIL